MKTHLARFLWLGALPLALAAACTQSFGQYDSNLGSGGTESTASNGPTTTQSSASTASGTSSGGSGGASTTTTTTSTGAGSEVCDDGKDNDGNKLIDCGDPSCSKWQCSHGTNSYTSPVIVYQGNPQGAPAGCPPEYPTQLVKMGGDLVCGATKIGGGCPTPDEPDCSAPPPAPFYPKVCAYKAQTNTCPQVYYTKPFNFGSDIACCYP